MTTPCPCGSQKELADCCLPYVEGRAQAPTAEALMRSRFTAYAINRVDYILATYDPRIVMKQDAAGIADWTRRSQFWKLEILKTEAGGPDDLRGTVHFNATIFENNKVGGINERSNFERLHGKWYYKDGKHFPFKAPGPNDTCPCGSGKKYKKCHGNQ